MNFRDSIYYALLQDDLALIRNGVQDLPAHFSESLAFLQSIPAPKLTHAYAEGKWTVAELIGHLSDTQTVFLNRILYIARGEPVPMHPFDEGIWVRNGGHNGLGREALLSLYESGSKHVAAVVGALPAGSMAKRGVANNVDISVEEIILYLMAHEKHHLRVIRERYLS